MTQSHLQTTITSLVNFLIHNATPNKGQPMLTEFFWPEEKSWHPQISNFDDTGDILPFVAWAGKIFKKPSWLDFVRSQYQWWTQNARHPSGWYQAVIDHHNPKLETRNLKLISLYDHQDSLTGLYNLYLLTKDNFYSRTLDQLLTNLAKLALQTNGIIPNKIIILNEKFIPHPLTSASPAVSGLVAEHLFLRGNKTQNHIFLKAGHTIINRWLSSRFWHSHHLLPQGLNPYLPNFPLTPQNFLYPTTKIMKENSNFLYALLAQPQDYPEAINQLTDKLLAFRHPSSAFFSHYHIKNRQIIRDRFDKTQNFTLIDLLTNLSKNSSHPATPTQSADGTGGRNPVGAHSNDHRGSTNGKLVLSTAEGETRDRARQNNHKLISITRQCADFWLSQVNHKTSLIPDYLLPTGQPQYPIAKLDQSADLYSSFLHLYCLTQDKKYLRAAQAGAQYLSKYFGPKSYWHRIVNIQTGHPAQDSQVPPSDRPAARNLTKYVGGALRFYLSLWEIEHSKSMQDPLVWALSRDR
jgi:hypothetical protein